MNQSVVVKDHHGGTAIGMVKKESQQKMNRVIIASHYFILE